MKRDLRDRPLYKEVEEHYRKALEPSFGRISTAADVQSSSEGRWIAFTGGKLEKLEGVPRTRICTVPVDGSRQLEEITAGPNDDRSARWSPDSSTLAFLSDRAAEGRHQLYLLSAARVGEAKATPAVAGTVEYLEWSAGGGWILLGAAGIGAELAGVQGSGSAKRDGHDLPSWIPENRTPRGEDEWRRVWQPLRRSGLRG